MIHPTVLCHNTLYDGIGVKMITKLTRFSHKNLGGVITTYSVKVHLENPIIWLSVVFVFLQYLSKQWKSIETGLQKRGFWREKSIE